jgi:hypothetical protein
MDSDVLKQEPLFNLTRLDFFNLAIKSDNQEWEKFIEEMTLLRFYCFRLGFVERNMDILKYFLNLVEGNFLYYIIIII